MQDKAKVCKTKHSLSCFFLYWEYFLLSCEKLCWGDVIDKIFQGILELNTMSFIPSIHLIDILVGVGVATLIKFIVYTKGKNAKKFRQGREYGSARWVA